MMVLFGFIGLFIVTNSFFIAEWILHIEGPYSPAQSGQMAGKYQAVSP
jgi:quinone-modifying oxidoreductase subunit QmoC